jgi:putative PEP-CTERM system TPR-repeat lipoprotein
LLGRVQLSAGRLDEAWQTFSALAARYPNSIDLKLQLAATALARNDLDASRVRLEEVLAHEPEHRGGLRLKARLDLAQGRFAGARAAADKLKGLDPQSAEADRLIGDIHLAEGRPDQAVQVYRLVAQQTGTTEAIIRLADAEHRAGRVADAKTTLNTWLEAHPDDVQAKGALAALEMQAGETQAAIARYEAILSADPGNVVALNNLAYLHMRIDDQRALDYAERAYRIAGNAYQVLDTYGWMLIRQNQIERGLDLLRRAAALGPQDRDVQYHLAAALAKAGDRSEAVDTLRQLLDTGAPFAERQAAEALYAVLK